MLSVFSLFVLIVVLGAQILRRPFLAKYIFLFSISVVFAALFYRSYLQYQVWSQNGISKFLLPPHQSANYFIFYVITRFFASYLISLAAAILFFIAASILNKKYRERFFYPEEFWLGALSLFLVGHPGLIFYFIFLVLAYLSIQFFFFLIFRFPFFRVSLYYLWTPIAIFVILATKWLQTST